MTKRLGHFRGVWAKLRCASCSKFNFESRRRSTSSKHACDFRDFQFFFTSKQIRDFQLPNPYHGLLHYKYNSPNPHIPEIRIISGHNFPFNFLLKHSYMRSDEFALCPIFLVIEQHAFVLQKKNTTI